MSGHGRLNIDSFQVVFSKTASNWNFIFEFEYIRNQWLVKVANLIFNEYDIVFIAAVLDSS